MHIYFSDWGVVEARNFSSGWGTIALRRFEASTVYNVRRFVSEPGVVEGYFGIPGGYLIWTVRKNKQDAVHAARVHGDLSGAVPIGKPYNETTISCTPEVFVYAGSSPIVSPFYTSPSGYVTKNRAFRATAVSEGLSIFVFENNVFDEVFHRIESRHTPIAARMAEHYSGNDAACYLLNSGNLYYEAGITVAP